MPEPEDWTGRIQDIEKQARKDKKKQKNKSRKKLKNN